MPVHETTGQSEPGKLSGFVTTRQQTFPRNQPWLQYAWGVPTMAKAKRPKQSFTHADQFKFN